MFKTLVKTETITIEAQTTQVKYFETRSFHGHKRFSAEIQLVDDRIILDDDSVVRLSVRLACIAPAAIYARMLANKPTGLANRALSAKA